jgi:hypothetical protein
MSIQISRSELNALVQAEVEKQEKKLALENKKAKLMESLKRLNEDTMTGAPTSVGAPILQPAATLSQPIDRSTPPPVGGPAPVAAEAPEGEESESIFDAKPGETIIFNFQDVTLKVQRLWNDLFMITDAATSKKLQDGDVVQIKGNDILKAGRTFKFDVLRPTEVNYQSNALTDWKIIKN